MTTSSGASRRGSHRLADVMTCERKWWLRYNHHYVEIAEKKHRLWGTLIHQVVAWHYAEHMQAPPDWYLDARAKNLSLVDLLSDLAPNDAEGVDNALAAYAAYPKFWERMGGDKWIPKTIEHEYEARVGDIDPTGTNEILDVAWLDKNGVLRRRQASVNDEIVTCRTDMVTDVGNGNVFIVDHKTLRGMSRDTKTLAVLRDMGEYTIHWQALFNLHVVRATMPHVLGFIIQRINRYAPYDCQRLVLHIPELMYARTPGIIRELVRRELILGTKIAEGKIAMPSPWMCETRWGPCDYRALCSVDTPADAERILQTLFVTTDLGEENK